MDIESILLDYSPEQIEIAADAELCERDLAHFYKQAWSSISPAPYVHNWHLECLADHLMAVSDGEIRKLLINEPPGFSKSSMVSIAWQAWTWAQGRRQPLTGPHVRFLCISYAAKLAEDNSVSARRLIGSEWYQERWGARVKITPDKDSMARFDTDAGGSRIMAGFEGSILGRRGDIKIIDDPHKTDEVESEISLKKVIQAYDEMLGSRVTDARTSAEVIIMQRLGEDDLSGHVLGQGGWTHVMLPMEYDPRRHCVTSIGWQDPRGLDEDGNLLEGLTEDGDIVPGSPMAEAEGELLDPVRFPREWVEQEKSRMGPFAVAGQFQQSPAPRGGGIIRSEWWQPWRSPQFPNFGTVVASLDTALKEKETSDYNALTIWGAFAGEGGHLNIMLVNAWRGRCSLATLVETVGRLCRKHKVDFLLIEDKTRGHDVSQEMRRLNMGNAWSTRLLLPKGDKVSRANAVSHLWSGDLKIDKRTGIETHAGGIIWAPFGDGVEYDWVEPVLSEFENFPNGKHDDYVDSGTQAVIWMRANGVALRRVEFDEEEMMAKKFKPKAKAVYDV